MIEPYKPLFIHLNPASIPEVVAHIQKYLTENEFVTVDDFGQQFQEYIDAHPDIIKVGSVNGLTGDVVLTSEDITMTGGTSETIGTVIGDILDDASAIADTLSDLAVDMDTAKTDIATLQTDVTTLEAVFTGATEESSGAKGLVPAPANTQTSHYLKATGDFEAIPAREVVSTAVSGAGTVEQALTAICTKNTYTQPKSINQNVTVTRFELIHNPILKYVNITIICTIEPISSRFTPLIYLPDTVPLPPTNAYVVGMDVNGKFVTLSVSPTNNAIINELAISNKLEYVVCSFSYSTT